MSDKISGGGPRPDFNGPGFDTADVGRPTTSGVSGPSTKQYDFGEDLQTHQRFTLTNFTYTLSQKCPTLYSLFKLNEHTDKFADNVRMTAESPFSVHPDLQAKMEDKGAMARESVDFVQTLARKLPFIGSFFKRGGPF